MTEKEKETRIEKTKNEINIECRMIFIKKRREQKRILKTKKISGETYENQRKYEKNKKKEKKQQPFTSTSVG